MGSVRVLFVEPPKEFWFVMGEYLPPPMGILALASYLETKRKDVEIDVVDCQARGMDWPELEKHIESTHPDVVAPSALATCNAYIGIRTAELAKKVDPDVTTVLGGQHFSALAQESLEEYPEIDVIIRGEGEETFTELVHTLEDGVSPSGVKGISFRHDGKVLHNPPRPPLENLDDLPFPGYHFVEDHVGKYHFRMMADKEDGYALIEGSRGCPHRCSFCSQWRHWASYRAKSPKRIADEMEFCYEKHGIRFMWLTDDNFGLGRRTEELCDEIIQRGMSEEIMWFMQARADDIVQHERIIPKMRRASLRWILTGLESHSPDILTSLNKTIRPQEARRALEVQKSNDIFSQATLIIGAPGDTHDSISGLREFVNQIDPDLAIYMVLTPFPGTDLYDEAKQKGWIEDDNWANYDMVHAIMPTETLSREEVQGELYDCYSSYYGSLGRRFKGLLSRNRIKRKTYRYLASQGLLMQLKNALS
jgi:anaerobic magnesium-protoporphyrin IX monomethyl ester cyclase